jgi:excisionase family DNA binding protein
MLTHVRLLINHMNVDELPEILTLSQACEMLNCHPNTLRNWDKEGILVAIRLGPRKDRRYKKVDVISFLEKHS